MSFYVASTRFSTESYQENLSFRSSESPVIYGCSIKICESCPYNADICVIEMNNETNRVEGMGFIKNRLYLNKSYNISKVKNNNRYVYRGKYWLGYKDLAEIAPSLMDVLECVLFKGRSHMKQLSGISMLTDKLRVRWNISLPCLKKVIKQTFATAIVQELIAGNFEIKEKMVG
jgi:hypothetical protein